MPGFIRQCGSGVGIIRPWPLPISARLARFKEQVCSSEHMVPVGASGLEIICERRASGSRMFNSFASLQS